MGTQNPTPAAPVDIARHTYGIAIPTADGEWCKHTDVRAAIDAAVAAERRRIIDIANEYQSRVVKPTELADMTPWEHGTTMAVVTIVLGAKDA